MYLPRLLAGSAAAALVVGTAACGAQAAEPKIALRDAASAWAAKQAGALELSIASSTEDVLAFAEAVDPSADVEDALPEEDLETFLSSSFEIAYDHGEEPDVDTDDLMRLVVHVGDLEAAEILSVDPLLYARVDFDGLTEQFPEMQDGLDSFRGSLNGEDGMEPAPAAVQEPATALLDGEWVSVDIKAYLKLMEEQLVAAGEDPETVLSDQEETYAKARDLFGSALKSAVTSVERREADEELGDHVVASIDLRKAWGKLRTGLPELLAPQMGGEMAEEDIPGVDEVPDKEIDISFWIRDGELSRVELDVAQFLEKPAGALVIRADMLEEQEITAPSGAVPFDIAEFFAGMPVGVEGEEFEGVDAFTVALWVDADLAYQAQEAGQQPSVALLPDVLANWGSIEPATAITAVGERVQIEVGPDVVCLTLSADGMGEDIVPGAC